MKKLLMGTTMLVGAALASGEAMAQAPNPVVSAAPYTVTLRGWQAFTFKNLNESSSPTSATVSPKQQTYNFTSQQRFSILADAKADNGLLYGVFMRFDAGQGGGANTLSNNRSWAYVQGGWGKIYVGDRNATLGDTIGYTTGPAGGAYFNYGPPTGDTFGPNGGFVTNDLVRINYTDLDALAAGYTYFGNGRQRLIRYDTPTVMGFHASFHYSPQPGNLFRNPNRNIQTVAGDIAAAGTDQNNHLVYSGYRDEIEALVDYQNTFGPVYVEAGIGGNYAKAKSTAIGGTSTQFNNFSGVMGDIRATYAGFAFQINGVDEFQSRYARRAPGAAFYSAPDQLGGSANLSYSVGPYVVGVSGGASRTGGDPTVPGNNRYSIVGAGGHYIVAQGMMLFAGVDFVSFKGEGSVAAGTKVPNNSPTILTVGTFINF